jgi:hypothetical protein
VIEGPSKKVGARDLSLEPIADGGRELLAHRFGDALRAGLGGIGGSHAVAELGVEQPERGPASIPEPMREELPAAVRDRLEE